MVPVFRRAPSEHMVEVNCKLKCSSGLDFSHTTAVLLSTASLQWNHLPLSAAACLDRELMGFGF